MKKVRGQKVNLKKVRSAIRNFILAAGLVVPLFSTVSCEIGLGESVDTQAPVISITYPPVGATIMEDFILSGTYADDKGITGVTVTIQGTGIDNGNFSMGPLAATYADNIWQINLNKSNGTGIYNGYDIPDGPIEVTVNVSDGGNHTTTEKRALEIDNTAPILILAKPLSTAQDASPTTYGRVLKLTGDIYDLHQSNGISVKLHYALYDREAGTIGAVKTLDGYSINSSMTDDSPLIIAQYYPTNEANDDAKKAMRQNYITLYGTDADAGNGHTLDKIFYCGVQLTDCAKVYRNPADQTGADKGNTTERYYINSTNFYNELQSESSTRTGGKNFNISATKIAKMFNGTGTEYSADDKAVIIDVLNTKGNWSTSVAENINTEESSKFLINPDNSPTWNVSGYELGNALGDAVTGFRALAQGSSVSFNINAGRDNTLIRPETVSVKLRHYTSFESYKSGVSSGDDIILLEKGTWSENDAATAISQQFTPTGKDVTLRAGEFYVFVVEGIDRNTNDVVSADGAVYGFMVKRAETPPELYDVSTREIINHVESAKTIDEAAGGFTNGKNEIKISGKVKMLGQEFAKAPFEVSYTCSNLLDSSQVIGPITFVFMKDSCSNLLGSSQVIGDLGTKITVKCGEIVDDMADWKVVLSGKLCPEAPSKYKITVNIVIKNASDITSAAERINFYVDNMEPEVKNEKVSPYVVVGESNVLNGKVKYSASITDNNEVADENIGTWCARNGNAEIAKGPIDKTDFTTTAINTTLIGETGTLTIEADAYDKVGNLKEHIKTYAVDQKTDKPVITPGNYKTDVAADDIKVNSNLFGITSNNKIYATITDDDGIGAVRVYGRLLSDGTEENLIMEKSGDGMLTYALTIDLNTFTDTFTDEGKYEFRVEVDDILGETDYSKIKERDHVFYAGVSSGAPSIQRKTQDNLYVSTETPCLVEGTVDVKAVKVLRHTTVNASDEGVPVAIYKSGDAEWSDRYTAPEEKGGKVYYFAYDVFGQTTAATFTYRIDVKAPTVAPDWTGSTDAKKWTNASSVAFKIPLSDEWDNTKNEVIDSLSSSGIESASYWVDTYNPAGDPSGPLAGRNQYNDSKYGNKYMNYDATIEFTDGKHKVYVLVKDNAGNKLEIKDDSAYEYLIDTTPPVIESVTKNISADKTLNAYDVKPETLAKSPVTITVSAKDEVEGRDVSGIDKYMLVENNRELTLDANAGVFSLTSEILTHGVHNFTVRAYDKAGNYSDSDPVEIRVDSTKPVASVTSVTPTVTVKEGSENKTYVNGVISISGSASDETALGTADGTVEVFVDDDSIGDATLTGQSWTLENYNTKDLTDNTEHKIKVVVTDKAGNKGTSAEYTINVKQSTDTPVVEPSNYKTNISADELETNKNLFGKTSNNKLIANITDDDGIDEVVVSYKKNSDSSWTEAQAIKVSTAGNIEKSYTLNYDLSAHEEGKWNFKIEVTDVRKETNSEYMNTPVVFNIGVSDGAPAISLTTADNTWQQPNTPFPVTGNVASKAVKIELRKDGNVESLEYTPGTTTWSHSIKSTEGATVHFVAIDEFKQENSIPFTYKIDSHDPTIASDWTNTDANHGSPETEVWRNSGNLKLEIPVSDSWNGNFDTGEKWGENSISGISRVYYTVDDDPEEGTTEGNLYGVGNKANYRYYKTTLALSDGSHVVKVFVVDDAARIINRTYVYNIDTNAPKITDSKFIVNGSVLHAATVSKNDLDNMGTRKIKITANVTDLVLDGITHVSEINTVELYDGNAKVAITPTVSSEVYTFEFPNEGATRTILTDGTHSFTVRATDNVGNVSTGTPIMVTVDGTLPSAAVSGVSPTVTKDTTTYINGIVKFTGTVSDNSALGEFIYFYVNDTEYGKIRVDAGLTYKAWEMSVDTTDPELGLTDGVKHKFTVKVSDAAGNQTTSAEYKVTVDQDTDIPVIAFANLSAGDNVFGTDGKDKITFTVTEDDLIKSIKVYVDDNTTASYVYEPASPELSTKTVSLNVTASANDVAKGDIKLDEEGIHKINIVVEDNLLRTGESAKKTGDTQFILDNSVPDLSETKIGESGLITNGGADKKIVISLAAADGYGLKKIEITDSMNASSKWELTPESGELKKMSRDHEIMFGSVIGTLTDGNHVITIKATDLAGKTTQIKRNVTVDTVNPKFEKVSEGDSSAAPKITTASTVIDSKSWYKSQQVSLKVMTSDASGSGVSNVEWTTDDAASESAVWSSLTKDSGTEGLWAGTVTPLVQGVNTITVRITDRAGNSTSAELYPYVDTEVPAETVLVEVDKVAGEDVDRKIVNGTADVVVLLKAKDTGSVAESKATGIRSVSVSRIGSTAITDVDGTPTANADEFEIVIPKEKLATGMVIVKATDKVGNFLDTSLFQMELDNTPPKVKISNPASAKTGTDIYVNRKISFSGTSSDKNLDDASRPTLEYSRWDRDGSAWGEWKRLSDINFTLDTTAGTWTTLPVNTETAFVTGVETKVPDGAKVKVRAKITDKAGNLSDVAEKENTTDTKPQCETKEFIVDQNTDRPVIRVTSPNTFKSKNAEGALVDMSSSVYAWQKNLTYISGIVTDDDGSLTKKDADKGRLYYSTQTNPDPATAAAWKELDAESGSWQINFVKENGNPDDGKFTVHFMVKDNEGMVYTSTATVDRDKSIFLTDGTNEYGAVGSAPPKNNTVFYIGIDNSAPLVSNVEYTMFSKKRNADSATNTLFGGDTTKFKLKLKATDTNGIKKVTISHANFGASDPIVLEKDAVDAKGNGTYKTSDYIDISDTTKWTSGTYTFKVTAVDMADLEKVENISINIDNDAPEVTMTSPTLDERSKPTDPGAPVVDTVWGANVKATGAVNGTKKLYYAISTTDEVRPYMPVETIEELTASANFDTKLEGNFTDAQKTELTKWTGKDVDADGNSTPKTDGTVSAEKKQRPSYVTKDKDDKLVYREFNEFKNSAPSSWKLAFDGDDDPSNITTTHTKKVNDWLVDLGVTTKDLIEDNTFTTYVNLYLWIWAEDDAGNVTERSYPIEIDPQGSRPKIDEITNPEVAGTKVTGKVRVSGSATDDVKVKGVWLQFISAQHNLKKNVQSGNDWDNTDRIYGTASPSAFNFTKDDLDYMAAAGMKVFKIKDYKYDKEVDAADQWTVGDSLKTGETASDYAAFVKPASSSWNLKINTNSEFAPANKEETDPSTGETITTPTTNNVAFRVFAHDGEFLSLPRVSSMVFDTESPEITGLTLVQYGGVDGTTVIAQRAYKEDMFINSSWWLEGYVKDDTVSDLDVLGTELMVDGVVKTSADFKVTEIHPETEVTDKSVEITAENIADYGSGVEIGKIYELVNGEIYHTYKFALKLDTSTIEKCGLFKGKVEATDNAGHNATPAKITINVDKNAPAIVTMYEYNQTTRAPVTEISGGKTVNKKHKYEEKYNVSPLVQNSDGYYTFGSQVMEESVEVTSSNGIKTLYNQSGFARVAFYFMRRNSGGVENNQWLYDIMENNSRINVKDLSAFGLAFEDGLYWTIKRVTPSDTRNIVKGSFDDVRPGSLVKINGAYYTTTDESTSTQLVLSEELPGDGTAEITALVAKAQVVDHLVMESAVDGTVRNDDGDGMVESVKKTGTTWTWDASVNTKTIEDGPIELHYVVFDDAGNYSVGIVGNSDSYEIPDGTTDDRVFYRKDAINICNRAPRLSKVFLGTDLNGDNSYTQSEFVEYDIFERNGRFTTAVDLETRSYTGKSFRIKDKLAVMPEFVGGNNIMKDNPIRVVFSNDATKDEANYVTSASPAGPVDDPLTTKVYTDKSGNDVMKLVLSDEVKTTWDDRNNWAADGSGSKNSGAAKYDNESSDLHGLDYYMYLYEFQSADGKLGAESTDEEVNGGIGKRQMSFTFWDNTTDTVQGTSSNYCYLKIKDLIVDVVDTTPPLVKINPFHWNSKSDCSVPLDEETSMPLGHIDLETAEQPNPKVSGQVIIRGTAYDNTRHGGIYISDPSGAEKQVAKFEKGEWSEVKDNWPEYWKKFEIVEDYGITQDGHTVEWEMVMDMTTFGVDTGKILTAKAVDAKGNDCGYAGNTVAQTKKDALTAKYVMDFVPYIKGVKDANRSRLGRYPVRAGQEIVVEGMNFAKGAKYEVVFYNTANGTKPTGSRTAQSYSYMSNATADSGTWKGTIPADGEITIKAPRYSAYFEVKVTKTGTNGSDASDYVETSNNNNQNIKWNIEEGTLDSKGKPQITPGKNQWNDDRYLSVWNVVSTIPSNKHAKPTAGVFVKSKEEKISRVISNGSETKNNQAPNNAVKDLLIATWGSSDELQMFDYPIGSGAATVGNTAYGKSEACFFEAPPQLDTCIVNGLPWYVVLDNYAGGNSANAWGAGLYIARQGFDFTKDNFKATTSQHPYIIEAQGKEGKHDMAGVDEKKNQFINPHIAGYFDRSNEMYYMYISYYDTYARCLKYAAYKEKINKDSSQGNVSAASWQDYTSETSAGYGKLVGMMNGHAILKNTEKVTIQGTGANVVAGNDVYTQGVSSWTEQVGEYNDILIDPTDNVPVIVYYNKSKKGLQIARASGAFTTIAQAPGSGEAGAKTWVYTGRDKVIRPTGVTSDFGRYISAEVDDKGNLHIAAQEVNSGKLYYLYMTKSGSTYTLANSYLVDSTSAVGNWTDIHLGKDDANSTNWYAYEPVISYLDKSNLNTTSAAKVAWVETATVNGVVSASWEAMTDPAQYEGFDNKTSVAGYPSEGKSGIKSKLAVGFNSDYYAVDFLRGE